MYTNKKRVSIIGGGSAGLFLAAMLDTSKYEIHIYEQKPTLGRKFLVAGKGGFNLTYHEKASEMVCRYKPSTFLATIIKTYGESDFRAWLDSICIPTYEGSSKRVFPEKGIKPVDVLNAIMRQIESNGVQIHTSHTCTSFDSQRLIFQHKNEQLDVETDIVVWALGGASWSKTGSDGKWMDMFNKNEIKTNYFQASNCAFGVSWEENFIQSYESKPLKNILLKCGEKKHTGELVITKFGLEGNAIYPLSSEIRKQLNESGKATIYLNLKPMWSKDKIFKKLNDNKDKSKTKVLTDFINLSKTSIALLKSLTKKSSFQSNELLSEMIVRLPIEIISTGTIEEAISTVGGVDLSAINTDLALNILPNHYVIGEMLDYDAPTGGYLLQSCWSMAKWVCTRM